MKTLDKQNRFFKEWEQYVCFVNCLTEFSKAHDSSFIIADAEGVFIVVEGVQPTRTIFWSAVGSLELNISSESIDKNGFQGSITHGTIMGKNTPIPLQCIRLVPHIGGADIQTTVIGVGDNNIGGLDYEWRIDYRMN